MCIRDRCVCVCVCLCVCTVSQLSNELILDRDIRHGGLTQSRSSSSVTVIAQSSRLRFGFGLGCTLWSEAVLLLAASREGNWTKVRPRVGTFLVLHVITYSWRRCRARFKLIWIKSEWGSFVKRRWITCFIDIFWHFAIVDNNLIVGWAAKNGAKTLLRRFAKNI